MAHGFQEKGFGVKNTDFVQQDFHGGAGRNEASIFNIDARYLQMPDYKMPSTLLERAGTEIVYKKEHKTVIIVEDSNLAQEHTDKS